MKRCLVGAPGALVLMASLVLASCQGTQSTSSNVNTTLVVAATDLPAAMDMNVFTDPHQWDIIVQTYDTIIRYGTIPAPGNSGVDQETFASYVPWMAESVTLGDNNTSLTIKLRPGIKSGYGNELTAQDIKYTLDRSRATKSIGFFFTTQMRLSSESEEQIIDKYTIKLTPDGPAPLLLDLWGNQFVGPFDSTELKKHATTADPWALDWMRTHAAGFGPYTLDQFLPGDRLVLKANPNYWKGKPTIQQIIYKAVPSSASRVQLLQSGQIDIAEDLTPTELDSLGSSAAVKVVNIQTFNYYLMVRLNYSFPPLNNPLVGQALNYATPVDDIIKTVYLGKYAKPLKSVLVGIDKGYTDKYYQYSYDLNKARQLLTQAGYPNGFSTTISFNNGQPGLDQIARLLKDSWGQVGVNVTIDSEAPGTFVTKLNQRKLALPLTRDQALLGDGLYSGGISLDSGPGGVQNYSNYKNAAMDSLLQTALLTTDAQGRVALEDQMQKIAVQDAPAWVFIAEPGEQFGISSRITKFKINLLNSWNVAEFQFSK
jgi:peptide/nickel transport system substrate-binding protein